LATMVKAVAALSHGQPLQKFEFTQGPIGAEQVEIAVETCGLCHSDLSMLKNEWGRTKYPLVPGHEVVGTVVAIGERVRMLQVGTRVGLGWASESCLRCNPCLTGQQNLCIKGEETIVARHGGFAASVRCHEVWAVPIPAAVDAATAGPLFCGGITVFHPIVLAGVRPTDRVGVLGIGGLGHMALKFLSKWGCEVYAFTSSESKRTEALALGAHQVVNSRDKAQLAKIRGKLSFILSTVNVAMEWSAYLDCLSANGRLHFVGAVMQPLNVSPMALLMGQKVIGASPLGTPATVVSMLDFCARHQIAPTTESFPMSKVNDALEHLESGKARYRIVLKNDL